MQHMLSFSHTDIRLPHNGWGMHKPADKTVQYVLTAPGADHTQRAVLHRVIAALLSGLIPAMRADANQAALLQPLRVLDPTAPILKFSGRAVLVSQLEQIPPVEALCALPIASGIGLRFAGFAEQIPPEQIFASLMGQGRPAAITLDCCYLGDTPALAIRIDAQPVDEAALIARVRNAVQQSGEALSVQFPAAV